MIVERFIAWAETACAAERTEAIRDLSLDFVDIGAKDPRADDLIQLFMLFLDDPSSNVRAEMARILAHCDDASASIIGALAQDIPAVAEPVWRHSAVLTADELLHAARNGDPIIRQAIASRDDLEEETVLALAETAAASAVLALLENADVIIGPGLLHEIAVRLGDDPAIRAHLLRDDDLLPHTRQMLVRHLSSSLFALAEEKSWCGSDRIRAVANDSANRVTIDIAMATNAELMGDYVSHLRQSGQLTAALLLRSICTGNAVFFEHSIAQLAGVSLARVQSIIDDGKATAFRSLYHSSGLAENAYPIFLAAMSVWKQLGAVELEADVSEAALSSVAIDGILERVEKTARVDPALLSMLRRWSTEASRKTARERKPQALLTAA